MHVECSLPRRVYLGGPSKILCSHSPQNSRITIITLHSKLILDLHTYISDEVAIENGKKELRVGDRT